MKNTITWVKALRDYHEHQAEALVPFCTVLINQMGVDPDVPVSGIPAPLNVLNYNTYINALDTAMLARGNASSKSLTGDETAKMGTLMHNTDILVGYIESAANTKYPGNLVEIATVFSRFGLKPADHGKGKDHLFKVLATASCSATLECPSLGDGANYHWRYSTDEKNWTMVKSTHKSIVIINNLPHDVRVYFQYDVSLPVGKGKYPIVSALANDYSWSNTISELIPA
jgi:hypothetical protein